MRLARAARRACSAFPISGVGPRDAAGPEAVAVAATPEVGTPAVAAEPSATGSPKGAGPAATALPSGRRSRVMEIPKKKASAREPLRPGSPRRPGDAPNGAWSTCRRRAGVRLGEGSAVRNASPNRVAPQHLSIVARRPSSARADVLDCDKATLTRPNHGRARDPVG